MPKEGAKCRRAVADELESGQDKLTPLSRSLRASSGPPRLAQHAVDLYGRAQVFQVGVTQGRHPIVVAKAAGGFGPDQELPRLGHVGQPRGQIRYRAARR